MNCSPYNKKRMYQFLMDELLKNINHEIDNPSGKWADFNCLYHTYELIKNISDNGNGKELFCPDDIPNEPQIDNYTDLDEPKGIDCEPL